MLLLNSRWNLPSPGRKCWLLMQMENGFWIFTHITDFKSHNRFKTVTTNTVWNLLLSYFVNILDCSSSGCVDINSWSLLNASPGETVSKPADKALIRRALDTLVFFYFFIF